MLVKCNGTEPQENIQQIALNPDREFYISKAIEDQFGPCNYAVFYTDVRNYKLGIVFLSEYVEGSVAIVERNNDFNKKRIDKYLNTGWLLNSYGITPKFGMDQDQRIYNYDLFDRYNGIVIDLSREVG